MKSRRLEWPYPEKRYHPESRTYGSMKPQGGQSRGKKGFAHEQIIGKLREAEILLSKGSSAADASRKIGVTDVTCYRWRKLCGGIQIAEAKRMKVELNGKSSRLFWNIDLPGRNSIGSSAGSTIDEKKVLWLRINTEKT